MRHPASLQYGSANSSTLLLPNSLRVVAHSVVIVRQYVFGKSLAIMCTSLSQPSFRRKNKSYYPPRCQIFSQPWHNCIQYRPVRLLGSQPHVPRLTGADKYSIYEAMVTPIIHASYVLLLHLLIHTCHSTAAMSLSGHSFCWAYMIIVDACSNLWFDQFS